MKIDPTGRWKLFDSHCHLDDRCYDADRAIVIDRARQAGVEAFMIVGITPESSRKAADIARETPGAFSSAGIHPHDARHCSDEAIQELIDLAAANPRVRAWGEIGLDFNRLHSPRKDQEKWFQRQLAAAAGLNLPLIFHERDSGGRFLEILQSLIPATRQTGVVHCFSGDKNELRGYLDLGLYIGLTGILTIKKRGTLLREMVDFIPEDRLLIETDAPYLTPAPDRNQVKRNEPALVKSVFLKLAQVKGQAPERLAPVLWENTCRLFNI